MKKCKDENGECKCGELTDDFMHRVSFTYMIRRHGAKPSDFKDSPNYKRILEYVAYARYSFAAEESIICPEWGTGFNLLGVFFSRCPAYNTIFRMDYYPDKCTYVVKEYLPPDLNLYPLVELDPSSMQRERIEFALSEAVTYKEFIKMAEDDTNPEQ